MESYMTVHRGKGKELCDLLRKELQVPPGARSFSVHFELDDVVFVKCEYMPKAEQEQQG